MIILALKLLGLYILVCLAAHLLHALTGGSPR